MIKKRENRLTDISTTLDKAINSLGIKKQIKSNKVLFIWSDVVGRPISNVAQPYSIKGRTLFVNVRDSVWLHELRLLESTIIEKINATMACKCVTKIYFNISEHRKQYLWSDNKQNQVEYYRDRVLSPPPDEVINSVADCDIREILIRIKAKIKEKEIYSVHNNDKEAA